MNIDSQKKSKISCSKALHAGGFLLKIFLLTLVVTSPTCCVRKPKIDGLAVTDHETRFEIDLAGKRRGGVMHVPPLYDKSRPHSLLFALHGASGTGELFQKIGLFDKLADELDFIVVYPNGISRRWESADDNVFFDAIITEFQKRYSIDPARIYVTGHSAGAIKAYALAAYLPGKFAAIAPVAGCVFEDTPVAGVLPVSVLHIHARDDEDVPFNGLKEWSMLSAEESVSFWKRINGANSDPVIFYDSHGIRGTMWKGEKCDTAGLFYSVGGHSWPQLATDMIMDFFYNHPARVSRISIDRTALPVTIGAESIIRLNSTIDNSESVQKVTYFSNNSEIGAVEKKPWSLDWEIKLRGVQRLSAMAQLSDGSTIRSTLNPFILVTAPSAKDGKGVTTNQSAIPVVSATSSANEDRELEPQFACDGDFFTRWGSGWSDNENITLDLGAIRKVSGVTIMWEMAYGKVYAIELSADNKSWQSAATMNNGQGGIEFIDFAPAEARYIRMRGIQRGTEWGYSMWEIFVHGE